MAGGGSKGERDPDTVDILPIAYVSSLAFRLPVLGKVREIEMCHSCLQLSIQNVFAILTEMLLDSSISERDTYPCVYTWGRTGWEGRPIWYFHTTGYIIDL